MSSPLRPPAAVGPPARPGSDASAGTGFLKVKKDTVKWVVLCAGQFLPQVLQILHLSAGHRIAEMLFQGPPEMQSVLRLAAGPALVLGSAGVLST